MKMRTLHRLSPMPEVHHLWPLMTYWSPSRTIDDSMLVASEDATFGSVMANADRIFPSGRNRFHRPRSRALALSSSMMGGTVHRSADDSSCWWNVASLG